jgi:hypothetical protein
VITRMESLDAKASETIFVYVNIHISKKIHRFM